MKPRFVYVAYPIDQATGLTDWGDVVDNIKEELLADGAGVYDPGEAFTLPGLGQPRLHVGPEIARINRAAQRECDLLVAFLPPDVPTTGVAMEIAQARAWHQPVIVVGGDGSWALGEVARVSWAQVASGGPGGIDGLIDRLPEPAPMGKDKREALPVVIGEGGKLPEQVHGDDAGFDLRVSRSVMVYPKQTVDVAHAVSVQLPDWSFGLITGRSSTIRQRGLLVSTGVIDAGWRGELFAAVTNLNDEGVWLQEGERIAQLLIVPNGSALVCPVPVPALADHPRGLSGFGSSGR